MIPSFTTVTLLISLLASSASATPHVQHNVRHRAVARANHVQSEHVARAVLPNRSLTKRCKPRTPPAPLAIPTPSIPAVVPAVETPKVEVPKPEPPKADPPKADPPKADPPKADPPKADPPKNNGGGGGYKPGTHSGQMTFYDAGLGACGRTNSASDYIVAASIPMFDNYPGANGNPNQNPICGKQVQIHYKGQTIVCEITDRCEGCNEDDLDLTRGAFGSIANFGDGRVPFTWNWL